MPWVVDTCVLLDIAENDPIHGQKSSNLVDRYRAADGCVICPISLIELAPQFAGNFANVCLFLNGCGIHYSDSWLLSDTQAAFDAWHKHIQGKRSGQFPKKPIADILIGAFAQQRNGLLTRNSSDFARWFPKLKSVEP